MKNRFEVTQVKEAKDKGLSWLMVRELQKKIDYQFKDNSLLEQALRHASYINEKFLAENDSNERLEFLGDALLGAVVSDYLFLKYPEYNEGKLSIMKANLVSREFFTSVAKEIKLGKYLKLGKGEEKGKGRERDSILSCAFEALIGSIYLDSDFESVTKVILKLLRKKLDKKIDIEKEENSKSKLQKYVQLKFKTIPTYRLLKDSGPSHQKLFEIAVCINEEIYGTGLDNSKKKAAMKAAKAALEKFKIF